MLPPRDICQHNISDFNSKYPHSRFNLFWSYKQQVEKTGASVLDEPHLDQTTTHINGMLCDPEFVVVLTGIPPYSVVRSILEGVADTYNKIRHITLGDGKMATIRQDLALIYTALRGITNTDQAYHDPDTSGSYFIVGKSKVLMFIWGQTPGFDDRVRHAFDSRLYSPTPERLHAALSKDKRRYTPEEFCHILEELDRWVQAWPHNNGGVSLQSLYPAWPTGRIIDVTYLH